MTNFIFYFEYHYKNINSMMCGIFKIKRQWTKFVYMINQFYILKYETQASKVYIKYLLKKYIIQFSGIIIIYNLIKPENGK